MYRNSSTVEKPRAGLSLVSNIENSKIIANSTALMEPLSTSNNYASSDLHKVLHNSTRALPTKNLRATQINILPVIGSEVSVENSSSSALSRINSKVELTRKDI